MTGVQTCALPILQIDGRIQSREYQKQIEDGVYETRTAYEVSVSKLTVVEETEEQKYEVGRNEMS